MKQRINIIGGGASTLLFCCFIDTSVFDVHLYEKEKTVGRKLMVAGKGGFNLTHGEDITEMLQKYSDSLLHSALLNFSNTDLVNWLKNIGVTTYKGTSNRVFPTKDIRPADVLHILVGIITSKNISIHTHHTCIDFKENECIMKSNDNTFSITGDYTIYALGGKSWAKTGSDGKWATKFLQSIEVIPFEASNCGIIVSWNSSFLAKADGKPLKNISVKVNDAIQKGELLITKRGLEGGAIYAVSPEIRKSLTSGVSTVNIDLKPTVSVERLALSIDNKRPNQSWKDFLTKVIKLDKTQYALFISQTSKEVYNNQADLVKNIKSLPIVVTGLNPIDEAISTVGGIATKELSDNFELKKLPSHFVMGEMIDWDAPTGGYLLQACFSMGVAVARYLNTKKDR